jgi:hypothetical protein
LVFEEVRAGEERGETTLVIDNGELALLGGTEDLVGLCECNTQGSGDKRRGHDLMEGCLGRFKLDVA